MIDVMKEKCNANVIQYSYLMSKTLQDANNNIDKILLRALYPPSSFTLSFFILFSMGLSLFLPLSLSVFLFPFYFFLFSCFKTFLCFYFSTSSNASSVSAKQRKVLSLFDGRIPQRPGPKRH